MAPRRRWLRPSSWPALAALRNDRGTATLEFVLWLPVFVTIIALVTDLSFIYTTNANMWDAARDTARRMAVRQLDVPAAELFARNAIVVGSPENFTVIASDGDDVVVEITSSASDASVFGVLTAVMPITLSARVTMMREPE
ncbi:MAG: Flp pilus assembly protein TadG [Paracoccaceae bacterium]|jgi:Flp pilus assembly protein TadG